MNVAYMVGALKRGGSETLLLDVLYQSDKSEITPICIYRSKGELYDEYYRTGVNLYHLYPQTWLDIIYISSLRKTLVKSNIQIVHAHQPMDAFYAHLACIGLKIKILLSIHGFVSNYSKRSNFVLRLIHSHNSLNICVSKTQKKHLLNEYSFKESNTCVLYNGIDFEKLKNFASTSIRKEFNVPMSHLLLGSVGNFNSVRDQMTICRFLALLHKQGIHFSFIFAGTQSKAEPQYWDHCIEYCKENGLSGNVYFPGSRSDIPNLLEQLDAFIYSSDHDTFGIAVIEAMAMGIPVFVNDWEVMVEITDQGKHGVLYKTKDEKDLLRCFMGFLANRAGFINNAKEDARWAHGQYSIDKHIDALKKIYQSIIKVN